MNTLDFKSLSDRYSKALSFEQKLESDERRRDLVRAFVSSLDNLYKESIVGILPELKFLYTKNVGGGPNAVLKILGCQHELPERFIPTASTAASSVYQTLGYNLSHARFWNVASIVDRAIRGLVAKPLDQITYNRLIPSLRMLEAGIWLFKCFDDWISYVPIPEIHHDNGTPHREDGPAFVLDLPQEKIREWFIQGVRVNEKIVLHPETQTISEIVEEPNEEIRRVRIDRYGWPKYLQDVGAESLEIRYNERDMQWEQLYQLPDGEKRFVVSDPSTGRKYALRVEDTIVTCQQAQNWMSQGLDSLAVHRS